MPSIAVTGGPFTYDGSPHAATVAVTGVGGATVSGTTVVKYNGSATVPTNADTYAVSVEFTSSDTNYTNATGSGSITISKAPVTATAGSGSATYDGQTHAPSACVLEGAYTGDLTCANSPASIGPGAGTTTIAPVVSGTNLENFDITPVNGSFVIEKAKVTATAGSYSGTYDGSAHSLSACVVTGAYTGDLSCLNTPESVGPNVSSGTVAPVVSGTGLDNFQVTSIDGSYNISKADATCSVSGHSGVYDGSPHGASGSCTGVQGEDLKQPAAPGRQLHQRPGWHGPLDLRRQRQLQVDQRRRHHHDRQGAGDGDRRQRLSHL